ncbi:hypothetical protein [Thiomicrorhabdus sp.]|uniref:hypothetical protein n=1 Tax=Thiomicrorhabdus sp. TaxID=2039724 RepID=UPI0029C70E81|nr:hypothetical protein [Thiomicrorhabdus sp.]
MGELILGILADRQNAKQRTNAILLAIDGAIIRAQYGEPIEAVLQSFRLILDCLLQNDQRA